MKVSSVASGKNVILLVAVCQLFMYSCAKQLYPGPSFKNIESSVEQEKLKNFLKAGTGKVINTHDVGADDIIRTAKKYLGVPHCMGGTTMKCMDCSGLLVTVFATYNILLPHNSQEQARYGKIVSSIDELKKGDLVFFIRSYNTRNFITHSGLYAGDKKFIHASSTNGVTITSLNDPWWNGKFIFGTRVLE